MLDSARRAPWLVDDRQLWSLLDMIQFAQGTIMALMTLDRHHESITGLAKTEPGTPVPEMVVNDVLHHAHIVQAECSRLELHAVSLAAVSVINRLRFNDPPFTYAGLDASLGSMLSQMRYAFGQQRFAFVRPHLTDYYERRERFGDNILPAFGGRATEELCDAGNCLALAFDTACAFHALRAAELAIRRFITTKGIQVPNRPNLDDADWTEMLKAVDEWLVVQVAQLRKTGQPRGSPGQELIETYNALIADARYFQPLRNGVMHVRHVYNEHEAHALFDRVGAFLRRMAPLI